MPGAATRVGGPKINDCSYVLAGPRSSPGLRRRAAIRNFGGTPFAASVAAPVTRLGALAFVARVICPKPEADTAVLAIQFQAHPSMRSPE